MLSANELVALPARLGNLGRLAYLYVDHNALHALPSSTARLRRLRVFHAQHNRLDLLPSGLAQLPYLTTTCLEGNCFANKRTSLSSCEVVQAEVHRHNLAHRHMSSARATVCNGGVSVRKDVLLAQQLSSVSVLAVAEDGDEEETNDGERGVGGGGGRGEAPLFPSGMSTPSTSFKKKKRLPQPETQRVSPPPEDLLKSVDQLGVGVLASLSSSSSSAAVVSGAASGCTWEPCRYDSSDSQVTGFLIDLDGTMYRPGNLIPGAAEFYSWLRSSRTPFVFLSNTGAKGSEGVMRKLSSPTYRLKGEPLEAENVHTAAEAQVRTTATFPHAAYALSAEAPR